MQLPIYDIMYFINNINAVIDFQINLLVEDIRFVHDIHTIFAI